MTILRSGFVEKLRFAPRAVTSFWKIHLYFAFKNTQLKTQAIAHLKE